MRKIVLPLLAILLVNTAIAQVESVGPITRMYTGYAAKKATRANNPIDSSFVYLSDTLTLPVFDDFSRSKFQQYDAQPTDPGVTQHLYYQLLDAATGDSLPADAVFSQTQTFRYVTENNDTDTLELAGISIKIGDFSEYPIVYTTMTVYPPYNIFDTTDFTNDVDTIYVPTPEFHQDSAMIFTTQLHDPGAIWVDHYVYHNYTFPINPWSLGVATFDGLDEAGYPYAIGTTTNGVADFLTSKSLDLSALGPEDSVYFSFVVQPQGFGDDPEDTDSLMLEFYDAAADQWNSIWSMNGTVAAPGWKVGHIRISQSVYFTNGFRFRFKNSGGLSGSLDHFHLDYVHLRTLSGYQDSIYRDFAWSYPLGSLLEDYTQVPWDHWQASPTGHMNDSVRAVVHNGWPIQNNNANGGNVLIQYDGALESNTNLPGSVLSEGDLNYEPFTTYTSYHDFSVGYEFDPAKPGDSAVFDIVGHASGQQPDAFILNDSTFSTQYFGNVYAYDDGSAEKAYGPSGVQARLAIKFEPYVTNDSLVAVEMHFVPSVNDVSDKLFLLTVWDDNGGVPGSVLYEDDFFYPRTPAYESYYNGFTTYYLRDDADENHALRLPIDGTFYVGWRQIDADRLNVGLDMNTDHSDKIFFSTDGGASWNTSLYDASVMIRPVFSTRGMSDLGVEETAAAPEWEIYPNPTQGSVAIRWDNDRPFPGATCVDTQGRIVGTADKDQPSIDLNDVPAGIYFIQLNGFGQPVKKVIRY